MAEGRLEDARSIILDLERRLGFLDPEAERLKAEITLRLQGQQAGGNVEAARAALAQNPDDPELKLQLAEALAAAGQYADALAICLELVERYRRTHVGERARQTMIAIFQVLAARFRAGQRISAAALDGADGLNGTVSGDRQGRRWVRIEM